MTKQDFDEIMSNKDMEFKVYPDKGVVVCRLLNCEDVPIRRIVKYTNSRFMPNKYLIDNVYTGVAKCAPEDTFDEEYGKKVALAKAKRKRGKAINRAIRKYIMDTHRDLSNLTQYGYHELPELITD